VGKSVDRLAGFPLTRSDPALKRALELVGAPGECRRVGRLQWCRMAASVASPSRPGIMASIKIRSGFTLPTLSSASTPLEQIST
jgi:hypothetical protein